MHPFLFWKSWPSAYRRIWYLLCALFILALVTSWVFYLEGAAAVVDWESVQEQKTVETTVHSFRLGPFSLSIPSESYVIFEYLAGSDIHHNFAVTVGFLLVLCFASTVLLTIITTLEKFWYFAAMSLFIIFLITLRLDVLELFGFSGQIIPIIILLTFVGTAFYFKYLRTYTRFTSRLFIFTIESFLLILIIVFFSGVEYPSLHLLITAYPAGIVLSILFVIMVAHEILVGLVYITNQGTAGNNVKHFALISFIYVAYVILTCLHEIGGISWDLVYIDIFLLLTVSSILGLWGFRIREPQFENIITFSPFGAFFYVSMAAICFATMAQLTGNANDPAITMIRQMIIFTHTGFGIVFLIYFFSNFMAMMAENLPVYNLLYKPNRMPYFTFRFAGLIASLAFLFYADWRTFVSHGVAGFYNYAGDLHIHQNNEPYAINFYEQSRIRSFQNHRANYALAMIKTSRLNFTEAEKNYDLANGKHASQFSRVNAANLDIIQGRYFDAVSKLQIADQKDPGSAVVANNLGFTLAKVHALDSASYYLNNARQSSLTKNAAEANFFAMTAAELIPVDADSVLKYFNNDAAGVISNAIALATLFSQEVETKKDPLSEKELDLYTATYLNNFINYKVKSLDTVFLKEANEIASDSINLDYREALKASLAHAYYHQGNVYRATEILAELAYITQNYQGKFNYIMGLWALDQGAPQVAVTHFVNAEMANYKDAKFYNAIAHTEAGNINQALISWDSLASDSNSQLIKMANDIRYVLTASSNEIASASDARKYQYCRYRLGLNDSIQFNNLLPTFSNSNYRAQALLDRAERFFETDNIISAIRDVNKISGIEITDKTLYSDIQHLELRMLASRNELRSLAQQINKGVTFEGKRNLHKVLYTAMMNEAAGDTVSAEKHYRILAHANPYFEEGIIAAAEFFRNKDQSSNLPYDILVEAIYVNTHSIKLLKAYAAEASRMGFDEYAASAVQRLMELQQAVR